MLDVVEDLKRVAARALSLDALVAHSASLKALQAEYAAHELTAPKWIADQLRTVAREIEIKRIDLLERRLADAKARAAALTPEEQKLAQTQAEIAELEKAISGAR